jgi:hypothetical protein
MSKDQSKPTSPEDLVKSSPTAPVELSETELAKVAGGKGDKQVDYLKIKLTDVIVSSY